MQFTVFFSPPGTSKNIVENQNKMSNKRSVIDMNSQNNYNVATTPKLSQQAKTTFNNQTTPVAKKSEEKQKVWLVGRGSLEILGVNCTIYLDKHTLAIYQ